MTTEILEGVAKTPRHTTAYLTSGPQQGTPIIFVHGWPELSLSWRHLLPVFGGLGFRAVAPDMRGYGRSSVYGAHADYALEHIVADMMELLDHLGAKAAIFVGHDWGSPVVWSIAQHHPERCLAVASLCVPYLPGGFAPEVIIPLVDRRIYPLEQFPAGQWDYQLFYQENFAAACASFDLDPRAFVKLAFRRGDPAGKGNPAVTAFTRANGGWFGPGQSAPNVPRDEAVLTEADEAAYSAALIRNGFFGPDSWYMNGAANMLYAKRAKGEGRLHMPALFLHGAYDYVCETLESDLAEPMRASCDNLTERTVNSGHWMAQEQPEAVSAALAKWLVSHLDPYWPAP